MNKIVIGIINEDNLNCDKLWDYFNNNGFKLLSINKKVNDVCKTIHFEENITTELIKQFRNRAYKISKFYWINLLLMSINNENGFIVIMDLKKDEIIDGVITPFYICNEDKYLGYFFINLNKDIEKQIINNIKRISFD
jgi:hypothetical protein